MTGWLEEIDRLTREFSSEFGGLNVQQLNWKRDPRSWSIAQNIQHLIVINRSYFPVIQALLDGTYRVPWAGRWRLVVNWTGRKILQSVQPEYGRKTRTLPIWEPDQSEVAGDIVTTFVHHHDELKTVVAASRPLIEKGAVISSPANRLIVYRLATAFDIIVAHERRHLEQAKRVLQHLPHALDDH